MHGVFVSGQAANVGMPVMAASGIPFVIGVSPIQSASNPAAAGVPVLCASYDEALDKLGYSDDWASYNLCEFMYSHFKLYKCAPVIFLDLLDPATMKEAVTAADKTVTDHKVKLPISTIDSAVVKTAGGTGNAYVKGTDYATYYDGEFFVIELLSTGSCYSASSINVAFNRVTPASITASAVATGLESIEKCATTLGIVPDLICAPGFSDSTSVAAVMATKANGINGMFKAKALIDISTAASDGADVYSEVSALKTSNNFTDENQILCWPLLKLGDKVFHMSTQLAGLMAQVDTGNGGCPYETPSNKAFQCDSMVVAAGTEVQLTIAQANILNAAGVVTALNFLGNWTCWGNYTACYPIDTDAEDNFIPVSRMFDWIGNTLIRMFWSKLDKPMKRRLIDSIIDSANIWINGLVGSGYIYGGRVEFKESENSVESLLAGNIKVHIYLAAPDPAQEIDFVLAYDAEYASSVFGQ